MSDNISDSDLLAAVQNAQQRFKERSERKDWREDQYSAQITLYGFPDGGGVSSKQIELACTVETFDAAGKYIRDPLPEVIRRGADRLEEMFANDELDSSSVFSFSVVKTANRKITQDDIRRAEIAAGIPPSC